MSAVDQKVAQERSAEFSLAKLVGPGLITAAAGIGAGDLVASTLGGAGYGLTFLWVVALAAFLKCFLNEGIGRWQLATETTAIEGWAEHLHYEQEDPADSLALFGVLRQANLRLLDRLSPSEAKRVGVHVERGDESIEHIRRMYAGHDILHLRQIDRIRGTVLARE